MSWVNNDSLSACSMWIEDTNGSGDVGYLFVNDNHQVMVTVGASFTNSQPTEDELAAAITFIDDISGEEVTRFKCSRDSGNYTIAYDPQEPSSSSPAPAPDVTTYNTTVTFYLSTNTTINPTSAGEKISVKFSLPADNGGTENISCSTNYPDTHFQTSVSITCYPARRYTLDSFIMSKDTDTSEKFTYHDAAGYGSDNRDFAVWCLTIDDHYFLLKDMTPNNVTFTGDYCIAVRGEENVSPEKNEWWNIYDLTHKAGLGVATGDISVNWYISNDGNHIPGYFTGSVTPDSGEYVFARSVNTIKTSQWYGYSDPSAHYDAHDQFGNHIVIDITTYTGSPALAYAG